MSGDQRFAEWLDRTLTERNITGGEIARALGVNNSAVSRWRNGRARPGLDSALALGAFLGIQPPMALAVTAGLVKEEQAGVAPLPMPENKRRRSLVESQIGKIQRLTEVERDVLMRAYDSYETNRDDGERR